MNQDSEKKTFRNYQLYIHAVSSFTAEVNKFKITQPNNQIYEFIFS